MRDVEPGLNPLLPRMGCYHLGFYQRTSGYLSFKLFFPLLHTLNHLVKKDTSGVSSSLLYLRVSVWDGVPVSMAAPHPIFPISITCSVASSTGPGSERSASRVLRWIYLEILRTQHTSEHQHTCERRYSNTLCDTHNQAA